MVGASGGGRQQHEDQIDRPPIDRFEFDRLFEPRKYADQVLEAGQPAMGNCDAAAAAGRAQPLALEQHVENRPLVQPGQFGTTFGKLLQELLLAGDAQPREHAAQIKNVSNLHMVSVQDGTGPALLFGAPALAVVPQPALVAPQPLLKLFRREIEACDGLFGRGVALVADTAANSNRDVGADEVNLPRKHDVNVNAVVELLPYCCLQPLVHVALKRVAKLDVPAVDRYLHSRLSPSREPA